MRTLRQRSLLAPLTPLSVAAAVLGAAGCSSSSQNTGSADSPSPAATSSSPATSASPTTSATPAPTGAGGDSASPDATRSGSDGATRDSTSSTSSTRSSSPEPTAKAAGTLPRDQAAYGERLVEAWVAGRSSTISSMAGGSAAAKLRATKAPAGLLRTNCEGNMCSWATESGRRVTLTFDSARVARGAEHAVTAVRIA